MARTTSTVLACGAAILGSAVAVAPASASPYQESILQDDPKVVFPDSPAALDRFFDHLKRLGVNRVRVSVFWDLIAPRPNSRNVPDFDGADPAEYPQSRWERYDRVVRAATSHGLGLLFTLTGPAPRWAASPRIAGSRKYVKNPSSRLFREFVAAVGRRYSGSYPDPEAPPPAPEPFIGVGSSQQQPPQRALPRVDTWSIWNEPNYPSWLWPQWRRVGRRLVPAAPAGYRRLVDAAYRGLAASGHGRDAIILGETAPMGERKVDKGVFPLIFLRELYCLNRRYRPYRGQAARLRGCPDTARERGGFVAAHPLLFRNLGWAHHTYNKYYSPTWRHPDRDAVTIGDLRRLIRAFDRSLFAWSQDASKPIWLTEHGWQTRPPDPTTRVSLARQAAWIPEADFVAYRNRRVASVAQFLLDDDPPRAQVSSLKVRWGTWQSGLRTQSGEPKPAYYSYAFPFIVRPRRISPGDSVRVWGQFRPAPEGSASPMRVEFRPAGGGDWVTLFATTVTNLRGYLDAYVAPPGSGWLRAVWTEAGTGKSAPSPPVRVLLR